MELSVRPGKSFEISAWEQQEGAREVSPALRIAKEKERKLRGSQEEKLPSGSRGVDRP